VTEEKYKANLICIFPTNLLVSEYPHDFKKEFKFARELDYDNQQITGVFRSKDTYVLRHPELEKLKAFFYASLNTYCESVIGTKHRVNITQAWVQRNGRGSFTHEHTHPNSIISGVFYFRNDEQAPINFTKDTINRLTMKQFKQTKINSESFTFHPKAGELILFPSHLRHNVLINPKEESRYSLAFNSFCFEELGTTESLTHLNIKEAINEGKSLQDYGAKIYQSNGGRSIKD
jgi:uncharacterized protein (TIGR02466 family)